MNILQMNKEQLLEYRKIVSKLNNFTQSIEKYWEPYGKNIMFLVEKSITPLLVELNSKEYDFDSYGEIKTSNQNLTIKTNEYRTDEKTIVNGISVSHEYLISGEKDFYLGMKFETDIFPYLEILLLGVEDLKELLQKNEFEEVYKELINFNKKFQKTETKEENYIACSNEKDIQKFLNELFRDIPNDK